MLIYSTTNVVRCRDGEHVSRVSLTLENVTLGCWAWSTPLCSWSFFAGWFFNAGTRVLWRDLAPSLHLYLFLSKMFLLPYLYTQSPGQWWVVEFYNHGITAIRSLFRGITGFKVVALAIMLKSNLNTFLWRGTVVGLICVSAVLWRSLLACMSYRRKKEMKIASNSKCYSIN